MSILESLREIINHFHGKPGSAIVVGYTNDSIEFSRYCAEESKPSFTVHGAFDDRKVTDTESNRFIPILGQTKDLHRYVTEKKIRYIFISLPICGNPRTLEIIRILKDTTASVYFIPPLANFEPICTRFRLVNGKVLISIHEKPFVGPHYAIKRLTDLVLSALGIVLLSPALVSIGLAVKLTSPGSIIFKQRRYGLDGREITVYKYRSMVVNEDGSVVNQAKRNDTRLTPIGNFLRRTSLDELPQLFNVLMGNMSIVGPRPHAVAHNELYRKLIGGYMLRHIVRPGITGWAQINGLRGETDTLDKMEMRVKYDLFYLRNWSLWLDAKIIFKTIRTVLTKQQAY